MGYVQPKRHSGLGPQVLIGMDIITLGDFAITNQNHTTTFSFRMPSLHTIDYQRQHQHHLIAGSQSQQQGVKKKGKSPGKTFGKNKKRRK